MIDDGPPLCYGENITHRHKPDERTHGPTPLRKTQHGGEAFWTCPKCGWLLKTFLGEHVDDWGDTLCDRERTETHD